MEGKFRSPFVKYIYCLLTIIVGSFIAIRFASWGVWELNDGYLASAIFCFVFAFVGLLFGFLAIVIFNFNRNAYCKIENGILSACHSWNKNLEIELSSVTSAEVYGKNLKLICIDAVHWIYGMGNAKDFCEYIQSSICQKTDIPKLVTAQAIYDKNKAKYHLFVALTVASVAFMFIHIAWCVLLTEGKELKDFSSNQTIIFVAFIISEIITVFITFVLSNKCGMIRGIVTQTKHSIHAAKAYLNKDVSLDVYTNIINKRFFDHYTYRIVVFVPKEDVFAYMLERFDEKAESWIFCYPSAKGFAILSELYDDIEEVFNEVILTD